VGERSPTVLPALLSALAGLLVIAGVLSPVVAPSLYEGLSEQLVAGTRGQDVMALALVPVAGWAAGAARRGSLVGPVAWVAVLAFWAYGYALLAFSMLATPLYPVYIAVLGLSVFALLMVGTRLETARYAERLEGAPAWPSITVLGLTVGMLAPVWLILMIGGIRDGQMPDTANVFVLDLGFIFPTMVTAIVGLVRRRGWAWPLAASLVILTAAMLGSLVVADAIASLSDAPTDPLPLVVVFAALAAAAVGAAWGLLGRLKLTAGTGR
jgi:hypothetical protein